MPELAHMDLRRLRAYRRTLVSEELRVSYWRRLIQARRDLVRAETRPGDRGTIAATLARHGRPRRQVMLALHPDGALPTLPQLPLLWASDAAAMDYNQRSEMCAQLATAESVLSSYRMALHQRLDRATAELVARYHADPVQCVVALPLER
jgi:hypothetical protein